MAPSGRPDGSGQADPSDDAAGISETGGAGHAVRESPLGMVPVGVLEEIRRASQQGLSGALLAVSPDSEVLAAARVAEWPVQDLTFTVVGRLTQTKSASPNVMVQWSAPETS